MSWPANILDLSPIKNQLTDIINISLGISYGLFRNGGAMATLLIVPYILWTYLKSLLLNAQFNKKLNEIKYIQYSLYSHGSLVHLSISLEVLGLKNVEDPALDPNSVRSWPIPNQKKTVWQWCPFNIKFPLVSSGEKSMSCLSRTHCPATPQLKCTDFIVQSCQNAGYEEMLDIILWQSYITPGPVSRIILLGRRRVASIRNKT